MKPGMKEVYLTACEMFFDQAEQFFQFTSKEESDLDECDLIIVALAAHVIEAMYANGTTEFSVKSDSHGEEKELFLKLQHDTTKQVVH